MVTVTLQVDVFSPALAVMVAVPALTAFTFPSVTVATAESEVLHVTVLSVALSGFTVAINSASCPSTRPNSALSKVTSVTSTLEIPACFTVNFIVTVPHLIVTVASRSFVPVLAWADTVMVTAPALPLVG